MNFTFLTRLRDRAREILGGFTSGQRTMVLIAVATLLVGAVLFTRMAPGPSMAPLFSDLDPADAAAITEKLSSTGTSFELGDGGRTILVPRSEMYQLRLQMSAEGLPSGGNTGYGLLDKQGLTISEFRQRVDYQRALEGELAKTISAIDGVSGAVVRLVIPSDDVFADDEAKTSASVLVKVAPGQRLSAGQVRSIVNLVASSVEGLTPETVTVADNTGRLLSADDEMGAGDLQDERARGYEKELSGSAEDLLANAFGAGHATVKVRAELDMSRRATTTKEYNNDEDPATVSESTQNETYEGTGGGLGGILGPDAGPDTGGAAGDGTTNYEKDEAHRTFAIDERVEQVTQAPGQIKRLTVAVMVDAGIEGLDPDVVESLVAAAVGLDADRGDTIEVAAVPFDNSAAEEAEEELAKAEASQKKEQMFKLLSTVAAVLIVALTVLLAWFSLRRRHRSEDDEAEEAAVETPTVVEQIGVDATDVDEDDEVIGDEPFIGEVPTVDVILGPEGDEIMLTPNGPKFHLPPPAAIPEGLEDMLDKHPQSIAQLLRYWLADDQPAPVEEEAE